MHQSQNRSQRQTPQRLGCSNLSGHTHRLQRSLYHRWQESGRAHCPGPPRSAEIIKPLLHGRDIKRYKAEWKDLWLINSHNGVKELGIPCIDVPKDYPAIYQHLLQFEEKLKKRQDKGDHWTNLRNCAYIQEFEKKKIIF